MDTTNRNILLHEIAITIADYRRNEISPLTAAHVERWVNQFDQQDQYTILSEVNSILKRFYFSRSLIKDCLRNFVKNTIIGAQNALTTLSQTYFLDLQIRGTSQKAMLAMVDEILREEYNLSISECGRNQPLTYVYIDDCIYTGSRLRYDLVDGKETAAWINRKAPRQCRLIVYTIGVHLFGKNYAERFIREAARDKGITCTMEYFFIIDNYLQATNTKAEVLWPEQIVEDSIQGYITYLRQNSGPVERLFRPYGIPKTETLFSSLEARRVVERAFLIKGISIARAGQNRAESLRPLGFEKLNTLGFGTFFTTYRNVANNCPLVLWWGDPTLPARQPVGMWYPLLPRKTNKITG